MFGKETFLLATLILGIGASVIPNDALPEKPKIWAFLGAGASGYWNYGVQSDVCHAFQVLKAHGVPDENIVVMMYDDVANSPDNPTPGIIVNEIGGPDVYHGVPKDYTKKDVTPQNVINILTGNKEAMIGIGSGKVIESGPDDHVLIFLDSHGDTGVLEWIYSELTADELNGALKKMHTENRYGKVVVHIDSCMAGSMVNTGLPKNISVFATTSSKPDQLSYFCYYDDERGAYIASCYSAHWMEDSDVEDLNKETVQKQFEIARNLTKESNPMEYGDLTVSKLHVAEFEGNQDPPGKNTIPKPKPKRTEKGVPAPEAALNVLYRKLAKANSAEEKSKLMGKIDEILQAQSRMDGILKRLSARMSNSHDQHIRLFSTRPSEINDLACHHTLVKEFKRACFGMKQNTYGLKYAHVLANMCQEGIDTKQAITAIQHICK